MLRGQLQLRILRFYSRHPPADMISRQFKLPVVEWTVEIGSLLIPVQAKLGSQTL